MNSEAKQPWTTAEAELLATSMNRKRPAPEDTDGASDSERPLKRLKRYDVLDVFVMQALTHIVRMLEEQEDMFQRLERHLKRAISDFAPDQETLAAIRTLEKAISGWKQQAVAAAIANSPKSTTHTPTKL
jgi:hypothetical protein